MGDARIAGPLVYDWREITPTTWEYYEFRTRAIRHTVRQFAFFRALAAFGDRPGTVVGREVITTETTGRGPEPAGVTVVTYVHCASCRKYFRSTLQFATLRQFEGAARVGLIAQCPGCYRIFDCNRANMYCDVTGSGNPESFPFP